MGQENPDMHHVDPTYQSVLLPIASLSNRTQIPLYPEYYTSYIQRMSVQNYWEVIGTERWRRIYSPALHKPYGLGAQRRVTDMSALTV